MRILLNHHTHKKWRGKDGRRRGEGGYWGMKFFIKPPSHPSKAPPKRPRPKLVDYLRPFSNILEKSRNFSNILEYSRTFQKMIKGRCLQTRLQTRLQTHHPELSSAKAGKLSLPVGWEVGGWISWKYSHSAQLSWKMCQAHVKLEVELKLVLLCCDWFSCWKKDLICLSVDVA